MVGELISLPLRATGLAARLWWRSAERTLGLASDAASYVAGLVAPSQSSDHLAPPRADAPTPSEQPVPASSPVASASPTSATDPLPPAEPVGLRVKEPQPVSPAEEPTHVSREAELVEEFAEPGAEDGAGPEIHIREPWDGYGRMNTREVTARLHDASAAELAAVQLYESSTRGRQTILSAVARQMRGANGNGARA
jgi:hypothetical protein